MYRRPFCPWLSIAALNLVVGGLLACSPAGGGEPGEIAQADAGSGEPTAAQTAESDDGKVTLEVPEGALATAATVTVTALDSALPGHLGTAYKLEPEGAEFLTPALLTLSYDGVELDGLDPEMVRIAVLKDDHWMVMPLAGIDEEAKTVSTWTYHFSTWSLRGTVGHGGDCFTCDPDIYTECCAGARREDTSTYGPMSSDPWLLSASASRCSCVNADSYRLEDCYQAKAGEELFGRCTREERDCCQAAGGEINSYGAGNCTCSSSKADSCLEAVRANCNDLTKCELGAGVQPTKCDGVCRDVSSDYWNCGGCGAVCGHLESCEGGSCECTYGSVCGGQCIDTSHDTDHCGECDSPCLSGKQCADGECEPCEETVCGDRCVDPQSSAAHCGACDAPCATGEYCKGGGCVEGDAVLDTCTDLGLSEGLCVTSMCGLDTTQVRAFCDQMKAWFAKRQSVCEIEQDPNAESAFDDVDGCQEWLEESLAEPGCPQPCTAGFLLSCFQAFIDGIQADAALCDMGEPEDFALCEPALSAGCFEDFFGGSEEAVEEPNPNP